MPRRLLTDSEYAALPTPDAVEPLDYEALLAGCKADLQRLADDPSSGIEIDVEALPESDPIVKVLEVLAYRELHVRQRINEGVLASLRVPDIDLVPAGAMAERWDRGGSGAGYERVVWEAMGDLVTDVGVDGGAGVVDITVLGPSDEPVFVPPRLLDALEAIRPLNHKIDVRQAAQAPYEVHARLGFLDTPDAQTVVDRARASAREYVDRQRRLGGQVTRDGLIGALSQPGIWYVALDLPATDVEPVDPGIAPSCANTASFGDVGSPDGDIRLDRGAPVRLDDDRLQVSQATDSTGWTTFTLHVAAHEHEVRLTHYVLRWGDADGSPLAGRFPIGELRAGERRLTLPAAPDAARSLLVWTANQNGESAEGARMDWPPDPLATTTTPNTAIGLLIGSALGENEIHGCWEEHWSSGNRFIDGTWTDAQGERAFLSLTPREGDEWLLVFDLPVDGEEQMLSGVGLLTPAPVGGRTGTFLVSEEGRGEFPFPVDVRLFDTPIPDCDPEPT